LCYARPKTSTWSNGIGIFIGLSPTQYQAMSPVIIPALITPEKRTHGSIRFVRLPGDIIVERRFCEGTIPRSGRCKST
jgi:hypothetical protein